MHAESGSWFAPKWRKNFPFHFSVFLRALLQKNSAKICSNSPNCRQLSVFQALVSLSEALVRQIRKLAMSIMTIGTSKVTAMCSPAHRISQQCVGWMHFHQEKLQISTPGFNSPLTYSKFSLDFSLYLQIKECFLIHSVFISKKCNKKSCSILGNFDNCSRKIHK